MKALYRFLLLLLMAYLGHMIPSVVTETKTSLKNSNCSY